MEAPPSLSQFIATVRPLVDEALVRFLPASPACTPLLREALVYSVTAGGKRVRPLLTLAAADAVSRRSGQDALALALPSACAVEFIHTYSLIHDDLPAMDNDTLRRGRATLHVVFGDALAILAGDALQAEAFALLAREPRTSDAGVTARKITAIDVIASAAGATGMVGGQAIDVQAAGQVPNHGLALDADTLRAMHMCKTGALIRASAVSGAVMAGGDSPTVDAVGHWGTEVGLAFQIIDDILDVEGNAMELGKTAGKDAADAKPTYPSRFGLEQSKRLAADCAERAHEALAVEHLDASLLNDIAAWLLKRRH